MFVQNRNNINAIIDAGVLASATTIVIRTQDAGQFPDMTLPGAKPFYITMEKYAIISTVSVVIKREIALCTNRVGNILTVVRGADFCVQDDSAGTKTYTDNPLDFDVGDIISMRLVAKETNDITDSLEAIEDIIANPALGNFMDLTTNQTVATGVKKFTNHPEQTVYIAPTTAVQYTPKQYVDDQITSASTPKNLAGFPVIAGEDLLDRDAVFVEEYPTFAESTTTQNVGDVGANTRVSAVAFGSGVSGSSIVLKLNKTGTPTPAMEVRIETDNAGVPSGTPVDPNAIGTIAQATISGISNYTINFAGAFTITRGEKVHIVMRQVGDVVNAGNYYIVYFVNKNTTTRLVRLWDGTRGSTINNNTIFIQKSGYLSSTIGNGVGSAYVDVVGNSYTANVKFTSVRITVHPLANGSNVLLYNNAGAVVYNQPIPSSRVVEVPHSGNPGTLFYVGSGNIYGACNIVDMGAPVNNEILSIGASIADLSGNAPLGTPFASIGPNRYNISRVELLYEEEILENQLLSKTDTDFAHKTSLYGLSTTAYTAGQDAIAYKDGEVDGFTGLVSGVRYYLDSVAGGLTTTPNAFPVGIAKNSTTLILQSGKIGTLIGSFADPGAVGPVVVATITAPGTGFLIFRYTIGVGNVAATNFVNVDFGNGYVLREQFITNYTGSSSYVASIPMIGGQSYPITITKSTAVSTITITGSWNDFIFVN